MSNLEVEGNDYYFESDNEDELVEVTPKSMRMRKLILDHMERKRANKD